MTPELQAFARRANAAGWQWMDGAQGWTIGNDPDNTVPYLGRLEAPIDALVAVLEAPA